MSVGSSFLRAADCNEDIAVPPPKKPPTRVPATAFKTLSLFLCFLKPLAVDCEEGESAFGFEVHFGFDVLNNLLLLKFISDLGTSIVTLPLLLVLVMWSIAYLDNSPSLPGFILTFIVFSLPIFKLGEL